jgi:Helix-turn-helix domain
VVPNLWGVARPARHEIKLSDEERSELVRMARAEKRPWREVQRARIVLYAAAGKSDVEIAASLDTSAGIVGRWRRRFFQERLDGLKDRPRAGRPRRFPPGAGSRGQGARVRVAGHPRPPAFALQPH